MKIVWSLPVPGEAPDSSRGDLVRARRLVAALRGRGHEVLLVAASETGSASAGVALHRGLLRRLLPHRVALLLRDVARGWLARRHARRVAEAAEASGAELLIETQVHGVDSGHRAARLSGLPLVLDDCSPSGEELALGSGRPAAMRRAFARQLKASTRLVVVTEQARRLLIEEGAEPSRLRLLPNGVDLAEHERARSQREEERESLGLLPGTVAVAFVGSFQTWHRVDVLVEALDRLRELPLRLVLVGDGPHRREVEADLLARGLGDRALRLGSLPPERVASVLAACDVGVMPDSNEHGHPMKLVEYAAAGLALVAPDVEAVRGLIAHEREGLLVPRADAGALSAALERLASDEALRRRLGDAARSGLAARSDWSALAAGLLA